MTTTSLRRSVALGAGATALLGAMTLPALAPSPAAASAPASGTAELPAKGTVFASDFLGARILAIAPDGSVSTAVSGVSSLGVAVDRAGDLFATDMKSGSVYEVTPDGTRTTVATGFDQPEGLAVDDVGDLYVASGTYANGDGSVTKILPGGRRIAVPFSRVEAPGGVGLVSPGGIAVDAAGDVFVADYQTGSVFKLTPAGVQTTVATKVYANDVAVDRSGNAYSPIPNGLLKVASDGSTSHVTIPGMTYEEFVAVDFAGNLYVTGGPAGVHRLATDGTTTTLVPSVSVAAMAVYDWTPQQISFTAPPENPTVGQTYQAAATGGGSGEPVVFSTDPTSQGCTVTDSGMVTLIHPATCVIDADQAGGGDYTAAPEATQTFDVEGLAQHITITSTPDTPTIGDTYRVTARGGDSGEPVTFSADASSGGCTVTSDGTVTMTHAQDCVIDADQAAGGDYAAAAEVTQSFHVTTLGQQVTFTSTGPADPRVGDTYVMTATGGASGEPVELAADPSSEGCFVTADGVVTLTHAKECVIDADQAGDDDFSAAPRVIRRFDVGQQTQTIAFTSHLPARPRVGQSYRLTTEHGDSGRPVVFSLDPVSKGCTVDDGLVTLTHAELCIVDADQAGDSDYTAAPRAVQSVSVGRAAQQVRFTSEAPTRPRVGGHYRPAATGGGSGYRVTFAVSGACSLSRGVVTFRTNGRCTVHADQKGSSDYLPGAATQVIKRITRH